MLAFYERKMKKEERKKQDCCSIYFFLLKVLRNVYERKTSPRTPDPDKVYLFSAGCLTQYPRLVVHCPHGTEFNKVRFVKEKNSIQQQCFLLIELTLLPVISFESVYYLRQGD